jgi:hypothetical protein
LAPGVAAALEDGFERSPFGELLGFGGHANTASGTPAAAAVAAAPDAAAASPALAVASPHAAAVPASGSHWKRRANGYGSNPVAAAANVATSFFPASPLSPLVDGSAAVAAAASEPIANAVGRAGAEFAGAVSALDPVIPGAIPVGAQGSNGQEHGGLLNPKVAGRPLGNGFFGGLFGNAGGSGGLKGASGHGGVGGGVGGEHSGAVPVAAAPDAAALSNASPDTAPAAAAAVVPEASPALAPVAAALVDAPVAAAPVEAAQTVPWTG